MRRWVSRKYDIDAKKIAQRYRISELVAEVLVKRGLFDWNAMDTYLFPEMDSLHDLGLMKDAMCGVELLAEKIADGSRIMVIGDYDVDGIAATYILYRGIEKLGGRVGYRIPHRVHDGYGIRDYMVQEAFDAGYDTIITCDNGISAMEAIIRAKELGMTVILTDHHEVPNQDGRELLPPADAVIDPKQKACGYPFKMLCGAGIVYRMMAELYREKGVSGCQEELLPFAAIATVCDVVPLLGDNRVLVSNGLMQMRQCSNLGLQKLLEAQQFRREINSADLGFRIGPCINAAGRLDDAALGMELFLELRPQEAQKKAWHLTDLNEQRKAYTAEAAQKAVRQLEEKDMLRDRVFVIYLEDCHESVAGIVAGRIREKYYRPVLIITKGSASLKGSARSIPGYHIQRELNHCQELLIEFGGHALAAGFSLKEENLEALRMRLNQNCTLTDRELQETVYFDKEAALGELTEPIVHQLECMAPFGEANEKAVFARRGIVVQSCRLCGRENQIARLKLRDGVRLYQGVDFECEKHLGEAICSRYGTETWNALKEGRAADCEIDILYQPEINAKYGGVEFRIIDCR
ncbi:MAG: single-stranded-DNA-specific exonuclease RecJ [Clostridiaceae bacterium]|nr:single-stranded-DNA-specific exonuclease RecJ [Clostridiaceae bacterium]